MLVGWVRHGWWLAFALGCGEGRERGGTTGTPTDLPSPTVETSTGELLGCRGDTIVVDTVGETFVRGVGWSTWDPAHPELQLEGWLDRDDDGVPEVEESWERDERGLVTRYRRKGEDPYRERTTWDDQGRVSVQTVDEDGDREDDEILTWIWGFGGDDQDVRLSVDLDASGTADATYDYDYDGEVLVGIRFANAMGGGSRITSFDYDVYGRLVAERTVDDAGTLLDVSLTTYEHPTEPWPRVITQDWDADGVVDTVERREREIVGDATIDRDFWDVAPDGVWDRTVESTWVDERLVHQVRHEPGLDQVSSWEVDAFGRVTWSEVVTTTPDGTHDVETLTRFSGSCGSGPASGTPPGARTTSLRSAVRAWSSTRTDRAGSSDEDHHSGRSGPPARSRP
ncbi:MAG: hypothetical protein H6738_15240 [Alphaproteobacteria bacterium]|nr:hypothetical protein [Alphaproteobacteria bacterium]MCB9698132.1 hypothetical protein [Alphaproteobacteria bacterium]